VVVVVLQLHMWIFIKVGGQTKVRLGEILSLEILISNKWSEPVDALLSIPASDDYSFVQIDREDGSLGSPVSGEQQVPANVYLSTHLAYSFGYYILFCLFLS